MEKRPLNLKLIACEILFREICSLAAKSPNRIDLEFLPKGLHDIGRSGMSSQLSEIVAKVDETAYDAIILGYALCSGGIVGVKTKSIPMVVPRAHDCITFFLGSRQRYQDYFFANSGTYFKTTGWIERGANLIQSVPDSLAEKFGLNKSFQDMVDKYGEDNARYIWEQIGKMEFYSKLAFIETGVEPNDSFEKQTRCEAEEKGWEFEKLFGDLSLLRRLLDGDWNDEDFLIVPPNQSVNLSYDDRVIRLDSPDSNTENTTANPTPKP